MRERGKKKNKKREEKKEEREGDITCSLVVASSGPLSSLTRINRGNLKLIPLLSLTIPIPALYFGDKLKSAQSTSHTNFGSNHTSGCSPIEG